MRRLPKSLSYLFKHTSRRFCSAPKMPPFQTTGINLLRGWPNPSLLPAKQLLTASQKALSDPETFVPGLLYGPDPGFQPLRESISQWLRDFYQPTVRRMLLDREGGVDGGVESEEKEQAERICITGGASQNLANVLLVYSDPQVTTVWIVVPCYFMACNIFDDVGCVMRAVGECEEGVDLEALEKGLEEAEVEGMKKVSLTSLIQGEGTGLKGGEGTSRESLLGQERNGKGKANECLSPSSCPEAGFRLIRIERKKANNPPATQRPKTLVQILPPYNLLRPHLLQPLRPNNVPLNTHIPRPISTQIRCPNSN
jgi:hypothetical protein